MSIFNDKLREALFSGIFECPKCGELMVFADEWEYYLECPNCGYDCALEEYGMTDDEIEDFRLYGPDLDSHEDD